MLTNGLLTDPAMSGCLKSPQLSTPNTTSEYSQESVHHHSLQMIVSTFGNVLCITS